MTNLETLELKPCPFCGNDPDWKRWEVGGIWQIKIFCDGDGCHVHPSIFGNEKTMTEIWNTRTPDPQRVRVEALEEAAQKNEAFAMALRSTFPDIASNLGQAADAIRALKVKS